MEQKRTKWLRCMAGSAIFLLSFVGFYYITTETAAAADNCDPLEYYTADSNLFIVGSNCDGEDSWVWEWNGEDATGNWNGSNQAGFEFVPHEDNAAVTSNDDSLFINPDSFDHAAIADGSGARFLNNTVERTMLAEMFLASDSSDAFQCDGPGFFNPASWVEFAVCEVIRLAVDSTTNLVEAVVGFLFDIEPISTDTSENALYAFWSGFRDIANVLFVVAFFAIIFSKALSINVDSYTLKKLVPRTLITVIAVQVSYFLIALGIDAVHIIGNGISGLGDQAISGANISPPGGGEGISGAFQGGINFFSNLQGAGIAMLFMLFTILIVLSGVFVGFLFSALREVFIWALLVISPIAFVLYLLPSTERLFKAWYTNLTKLLLMYPIMILIIKAGEIGALLMLDRGEFLAAPMAILMIGMSFFGLLFTFKASGSLMAATASAAQKIGRSGRKMGQKSVKRSAESGAIRDRAMGLKGNTATRFASRAAAGGPMAALRGQSAGARLANVATDAGEAKDTLKKAGVAGTSGWGGIVDAAGMNSKGAVLSSARAARAQGDGERANALEVAADKGLYGKSSTAVAGLLGAAGNNGLGSSLEEALERTNHATSHMDGSTRNFALNQAAREAKESGRGDLHAALRAQSTGGDAGAAVSQALQSMQKDDLNNQRPESLNNMLTAQDPTGRNGYHRITHNQDGSVNDRGVKQIAGMLNPRTSGLSSEKMQAVRNIVDNRDGAGFDPRVQTAIDREITTNNSGDGSNTPPAPSSGGNRIIRPGDSDFSVPPGSRPGPKR